MIPMLAACIALASLGPASQGPLPELDLRRSVERSTVAIKIYNTRLDREVETGAGSIVADDGEWLTISTAAHVLARAKAKDVRVRVLAHKHVVWIEAETIGNLPPADAEATEDVGFLRIKRGLTEFAEGAPLGGVTFAPASAVEAGVPCWAYGYDLDNGGMRWASGRVTGLRGRAIEFNAPEVRPGWSGGPLVIGLGPIGMTLRRTSVGGGGLGVTRQRIAEIAEGQSIPFSVGGDPVLDALCSAQELGRPLAISWHKEQRWIAIELTEHDGRRFLGTWVTYGGADDGFEGGLRGTLQLDARGDRVEIQLEDSEGGNIPLPSERGLLTMRASAVPSVVGHVVLTSDQYDAVHLAVPTGDCELLAARQLLAAASAGRGTPALEGASLGVFTTPAKVAGGRYFPFMLTHFASWTEDPMKSVRSFQVAEARKASTVRLRGEIYWTGPSKPGASAPDGYWPRTKIVVRDAAVDSDLVRLPRPAPPADSVQFDVVFEPSTRDFEFVLNRHSGRQSVGGYGLRGLVLDYRD